MPSIPIDDLHGGMNLRDPAASIQKGETGISIGCDFSVPGMVRPMRQPFLRQTLPADIIDACDIYIQGTKYRLTTHSDGLRASEKLNNLTWQTPILIDPLFTGKFKAVGINDEYVVLSNGTYNKKWMPGWAGTYQWGLNTPPVPTIQTGSLLLVFDDFEDNSGWTFTGGGLTGGLSDNHAQFLDGSTSLKVNLDALTSITLTKQGNMDLIADPNSGFNLAYLQQYSNSIGSITVRFSSTPGGTFNPGDNYFEYTIYPSLNKAIVSGVHRVGYIDSLFLVDSAGRDLVAMGVVLGQTLYNQTQSVSTIITNIENQDAVNDRVDGLLSGGKKWEPGDAFQIVPGIAANWVTGNIIPQGQFRQWGNTSSQLDWANITAMQIEVVALQSDTWICFDNWSLQRTETTGTYQAAVSYMNQFGNYGPYSDYCAPVTIYGASLLIGNLVPDTDQQTVARRIAILGGDLTDPWVMEVNDNTSTTAEYFPDITTLVEVETEFDNQKPPMFIDMLEWNGRIFGVTGSNSGYYSEDLFYEAFPAKNFLLMSAGEELLQVDISDQNYVAWRGKDKEYLTMLAIAGPAYWQTMKGADVGAISSRFLIVDPTGGRVYASQLGFYISGGGTRGYYLPKIPAATTNPKQIFGITDFSLVFGSMMKDRAYLYFQDKDGVDWVMRIDYRLGKMVAHFVGNWNPVTIWADHMLERVYYVSGAQVLEFDAGTLPLPTSLTIPEQLGKTLGPKDFFGIDHELDGDAIQFTLSLDRVPVPVAPIALPAAMREDNPVSLPYGLVGNQMGLTLLSTTEDWTLYLPIELVYEEQPE